jgi:glycine cleavage system protein P-like pyridoxal-binding family
MVGEKMRKSKIIMTCQNWQILENHVNEVGKVDVDLLKEKVEKNFSCSMHMVLRTK